MGTGTTRCTHRATLEGGSGPDEAVDEVDEVDAAAVAAVEVAADETGTGRPHRRRNRESRTRRRLSDV